MSLWKDVDGYEGLYIVSDEGEVISLPREVHTRNGSGEMTAHRKARKLKPYLRGNEGLMYEAVALTKDGETVGHSVHRLVAKAFIPNPDNLPEVNHKDKDTTNNCVENLEWCTRQYNIEYSKNKRVGQYIDGEKVAEYKSIVYASKMTGISRTNITNALTGWSKTAGGYEWRYEGSEDLSL
jgi:hypothetical protein